MPSSQQAFSNMVAGRSTINNFANPISGSAGKATLNFSCYLQQNNFNQQRYGRTQQQSTTSLSRDRWASCYSASLYF